MPNLKKRTKIKCDNCGIYFSVGNGELKQRIKKSKSGKLFHSSKCFDEYRNNKKKEV
jgi:hypothetical protein